VAPTEFVWKLIERHSGHPAKCVAEALEPLADYEQALDYGFVALRGVTALGSVSHSEAGGLACLA